MTCYSLPVNFSLYAKYGVCQNHNYYRSQVPASGADADTNQWWIRYNIGIDNGVVPGAEAPGPSFELALWIFLMVSIIATVPNMINSTFGKITV